MSRLYLYDTQITDISPLLGLTNLSVLDVRKNSLDYDAYCSSLDAIVCNNPALMNILYDPNPNPPTGVMASDGTYADRVEITWDAYCSGPAYDSYYMVYRQYGTGEKVEISEWQTATTFSDTQAEQGVEYNYYIKASSNLPEAPVLGENPTDYSEPDRGYRGF
jgi:hypothetical protein